MVEALEAGFDLVVGFFVEAEPSRELETAFLGLMLKMALLAEKDWWRGFAITLSFDTTWRIEKTGFLLFVNFALASSLAFCHSRSLSRRSLGFLSWACLAGDFFATRRSERKI